MRSNAELTPREFEVSFQIKVAMNALNSENPLAAKDSLMAALRALHA